MGRELMATSPEPFSNSSDCVIASGTTAKRTRSIFGTNRPAQRIALHDHILIDLLADESKRPSADRMLPEVVSAAFGNNADGAGGEIGEEEIIRMLQMKNDGVLVGGIAANRQTA